MDGPIRQFVAEFSRSQASDPLVRCHLPRLARSDLCNNTRGCKERRKPNIQYDIDISQGPGCSLQGSEISSKIEDLSLEAAPLSVGFSLTLHCCNVDPPTFEHVDTASLMTRKILRHCMFVVHSNDTSRQGCFFDD